MGTYVIQDVGDVTPVAPATAYSTEICRLTRFLGASRQEHAGGAACYDFDGAD